MKITTWNVNSLTARLQHVLDWLAANPVDVLALQELKMGDDKFPFDALREAGYDAAVFGQKTYNGVALLSRAPVADVARNIAGFADESARVIAGTVPAPGGPLRVINGYFVNGQAPATDKFDYKMSWRVQVWSTPVNPSSTPSLVRATSESAPLLSRKSAA